MTFGEDAVTITSNHTPQSPIRVNPHVRFGVEATHMWDWREAAATPNVCRSRGRWSDRGGVLSRP